MSKAPKFLILEDVETDAELVMDEVKSTFPDCSFKWVENEPDFINELKSFKPDLILTDYSLPTYNGMSALKYVLIHSPDTPVILVTGSINEETAVTCMRTGAVDYVLKDKMSRLGLAVKTALENKDIKLEKRKAQDEIKKLSTVIEQSPIPVVLMDNAGIINYVNPAFTELTEYNSDEIIGKRLETIGGEDITQEEHKLILKDCLNGDLKKKNFKNRKKSGEIFYVTSSFARYKDSTGNVNGLITMMIDITQSVKDKKQIEDDLKEKELLLQEIYHRVNNNMQIMISLLNMQVNRAVLDGEKNVLRMAQSRVGAISAIHNDIYQERSFIAIKFGNVTRHIFNTLCDSFMVISGNIDLKVEAEIPDFGLDLAQPCALIVNELISNSMRHAYPEGKGLISVFLTIDESEELTLVVKDDGVGIPENVDPENSDTTGFSLVYMLATGQLDGTVEINRDNGTTVTIKFKRIEDKKRF